MTMNSPAYAIQASSHSAQLFRQALCTLLNPAGGVVASGDFLVTQNGTPNMSVNVAGGIPGGQIWVPGTTTALVQAMYYCFNDATVNLAIAASNPTNPRIDIAVAQVQDAAYTGATNSAQLAIVTGTPAGSPVAPSTPASSLVLANIAVAALATTVVTANITDQRQTGGAGTYHYEDVGGGPFAGNFIPSNGAGTYILTVAALGSGNVVPVNLTGDAMLLDLDPGTYRLRASVATNAVAPAQTFTFGLYRVLTIGGAASAAPTVATISAVLTGSTVAVVTPGANSLTRQATVADFAVPTAADYVIGCAIAAAPAATSNTHVEAKLQIR